MASASWVCGVASCLIFGCASSEKTELLEARLREQEAVVLKYEREMGAMHSQLEVAQREANILREQFAKRGTPVPAVEATTALASVEVIKFNTLLTAGQNKDSTPGDERIHAVVVPYDRDGELVKVIGKVQFEALDLSLPEEQRSLGKWEYSAENAKELWHAGFLSSGYRFDLPWKQVPQGKSVLLLMKLETVDGRELIANHTLNIEPPPQSRPAAAVQTEVASSTINATEAEGNVTDKVDSKEITSAKETPGNTPIVEGDKSGNLLSGTAHKNNSPTENNSPSQGNAVTEKIERPEPVLDLLDLTSENPGQVRLIPSSFEKKSPLPLPGASQRTPRPFPEVAIPATAIPGTVKTSDNWTDATIPVLR